jgi:hypothetical protein
MPDFVKLIHKHRSQDLHPGEQVAAAVFVQPMGSMGASVAFGVAGAVGKAAADARRKKGEAEAAPDTIAARMPGGRLVLGISPQRLLVFEHGTMSGRPKELVAEFGWDQIAGIDLGEGKLSQQLTIRFADESEAVVQAMKLAKPQPFVDAYRQLRA